MKKRKSSRSSRSRDVTIKDIGGRIGVSPSTVARALADHPLISLETKQLVRKTADRMGYIVNSAARVMRGGHSSLVGLVIPDIQNDFYSSIAKTLSQVFERRGLQLALSISQDNPALEHAIILSLIGARPGGVIIVPSVAPQRETLQLLKRTVHVQLLRRIRSMKGPWFGIDDRAAVRAATNHLIGLGHRRIGYIGGSTALTTGESRLAGFLDAFAAARLPKPDNFVVAAEVTSHWGQNAVSEFLAHRRPPTALVMGSIGGTLGVLQTLCMRNISTPDQLSLVGFGDAPGFAWWGKGLSTIGLPVDDLATNCAEWLFKRLKDGGETKSVEALYPCSLILRGSTARRKS